MADDRYCRFATQFVVDGVTILDGVCTPAALDAVVNSAMHALGLPPIDVVQLYRQPDNFHVHYDICVNGTLCALEISALSGPVIKVAETDGG